MRHGTARAEQRVAAEPKQVFRAWCDAKSLERWYLPGDVSWSSKIVEHDFRVDGVKTLEFGPRGEPPYREDCRYEAIAPNEQIVFSMRISRAGVLLTVSLVTIALHTEASGTRVTVTDQMAIADPGHTADERAQGWVEVLGKLAKDPIISG